MREEEEEEDEEHAATAKSPRPATAPVLRHFFLRPPRAPAAHPKRVLAALPVFALYHAKKRLGGLDINAVCTQLQGSNTMAVIRLQCRLPESLRSTAAGVCGGKQSLCR